MDRKRTRQGGRLDQVISRTPTRAQPAVWRPGIHYKLKAVAHLCTLYAQVCYKAALHEPGVTSFLRCVVPTSRELTLERYDHRTALLKVEQGAAER